MGTIGRITVSRALSALDYRCAGFLNRARATCVMRETASGETGPTTAGNGYTVRPLSLFSGNSTTCGASSTVGGRLALTPGTYLVRVRASGFWNDNFAARIQQTSGDS